MTTPKINQASALLDKNKLPAPKLIAEAIDETSDWLGAHPDVCKLLFRTTASTHNLPYLEDLEKEIEPKQPADYRQIVQARQTFLHWKNLRHTHRFLREVPRYRFQKAVEKTKEIKLHQWQRFRENGVVDQSFMLAMALRGKLGRRQQVKALYGAVREFFTPGDEDIIKPGH